MSEHIASPAAAWTLAIFCVFYIAFLVRQLYRRTIDLYDFLMLSMIAIIPAMFILMPPIAVAIGNMFDVAFPFVIMFAALLLVVFVIVHHVLVRLHSVEGKLRQLVQEVALDAHVERTGERREGR